MRKIKDERLQWQNLKNIRMAFMLENIGIIAMLLYTTITEGFTEARSSPLWFILIGTAIILNFSQIKIGRDVYDDSEKPKKPMPYFWTIIIIALVSAAAGALVWLLSSANIKITLIISVVIFISFLVPYTYNYYLKKKHYEEDT